MQAKYLIGTTLVAAALSLSSGCQAWSGASFPLNNGTRVPPPGTGTYQLPNGYYGNTSALTPNGQVMQASNASSLRSPNGALPTTNLASLPPGVANNTVSNAQFTSLNNTTTSGAPAYVAPASYSLSDGPTQIEFGAAPPASLTGTADGQDAATAAGAPSLQWQQY